MAGQLLTSLKSASSAANALSHEAKLGMAVITILFFAFCFLVYHKMDLHQRQLTQASIAAKAAPADGAGSDTASTLITGNVTGTTTDPLLERTPGMINGSDDPGQQEIPAFAQAEFDSSPSDPGSSDAMAFSEPTELETTTDSFQESEPVAEGSFSVAAIDDRESFESSTDLPQFPAGGDAFAMTAENSATAIRESAAPQLSFGAAADIENAAPEFGPLETVESSPQPRDNEFPLSALDGTEDLPASGRQLSADDEDSAAGITLPEVDRPDTAGEISFDSAATLSSADSFVTDSELPEPPIVEETAVDSGKEPVLIAMLDPQDTTTEQSAADTYADRVSSFAPLDDFSEGDRNAVDNEPSSFGTTVEQEVSERTMAQQSGRLGSRGFDAVTQPGGRSGRNPVRTAAGSGADGKFSLAAFNSQNTEAEPAPDDGTTYEYTVVKNGENYSKISKRVYGTTRYFSALAVFNQHRIAEPKNMRPGMVVLTPSKEVLEERYPQLFVDSKPKVVEPAAFLLLEDGSPAYRVGERETLSEISQRFLGRSSRWVEILRLNQSNVKDPNKLKPGTILALPADATEVNVVP